MLKWDGGWLWLPFKRPKNGSFHWPVSGEDATMSLAGEELNILRCKARIELKFKSIDAVAWRQFNLALESHDFQPFPWHNLHTER